MGKWLHLSGVAIDLKHLTVDLTKNPDLTPKTRQEKERTTDDGKKTNDKGVQRIIEGLMNGGGGLLESLDLSCSGAGRDAAKLLAKWLAGGIDIEPVRKPAPAQAPAPVSSTASSAAASQATPLDQMAKSDPDAPKDAKKADKAKEQLEKKATKKKEKEEKLAAKNAKNAKKKKKKKTKVDAQVEAKVETKVETKAEPETVDSPPEPEPDPEPEQLPAKWEECSKKLLKHFPEVNNEVMTRVLFQTDGHAGNAAIKLLNDGCLRTTDSESMKAMSLTALSVAFLGQDFHGGSLKDWENLKPDERKALDENVCDALVALFKGLTIGRVGLEKLDLVTGDINFEKTSDGKVRVQRLLMKKYESKAGAAMQEWLTTKGSVEKLFHLKICTTSGLISARIIEGLTTGGARLGSLDLSHSNASPETAARLGKWLETGKSDRLETLTLSQFFEKLPEEETEKAMKRTRTWRDEDKDMATIINGMRLGRVALKSLDLSYNTMAGAAAAALAQWLNEGLQVADETLRVKVTTAIDTLSVGESEARKKRERRKELGLSLKATDKQCESKEKKRAKKAEKEAEKEAEKAKRAAAKKAAEQEEEAAKALAVPKEEAAAKMTEQAEVAAEKLVVQNAQRKKKAETQLASLDATHEQKVEANADLAQLAAETTAADKALRETKTKSGSKPEGDLASQDEFSPKDADDLDVNLAGRVRGGDFGDEAAAEPDDGTVHFANPVQNSWDSEGFGRSEGFEVFEVKNKSRGMLGKNKSRDISEEISAVGDMVDVENPFSEGFEVKESGKKVGTKMNAKKYSAGKISEGPVADPETVESLIAAIVGMQTEMLKGAAANFSAHATPGATFNVPGATDLPLAALKGMAVGIAQAFEWTSETKIVEGQEIREQQVSC